MKKIPKIARWLKMRPKNLQKIGFGSVLGSICEGFGTVLDLFLSLLGITWPFFGRSKSSFSKALVPDELQEGFWINFGTDLERFRRISEGLGRVFIHFSFG